MIIEPITEFIFKEDDLEAVEVILVAGGSIPGLMEKAAELYHKGLGKYILPSGGYNKKLNEHETEFEYLKEIGLSLGVKEEHILKEDKAANTFENGIFSKEVLENLQVDDRKMILVSKAYHARRAYISYKLSFVDSEILSATVPDRRGITKENWYKTQDHIDLVMQEVEKVGKYFKDHISLFT
jgi:uncharacterized SAM-binding protein YcdF (DUF218 family)